jgi:hypothetical protein
MVSADVTLISYVGRLGRLHFLIEFQMLKLMHSLFDRPEAKEEKEAKEASSELASPRRTPSPDQLALVYR